MQRALPGIPRLFIVGSRGIPAAYGGFERFAEELAIRLAGEGIEVFVTCEAERGIRSGSGPREDDMYVGVHRLLVEIPRHMGPARSVVSDIAALRRCERLVVGGDIVYLLGYGVGRFGTRILGRIRARGARVWINPDGIEWQRRRWPWLGRAYLKDAERVLVSAVDEIICDSKAIQQYVHATYPMLVGRTRVLEYGADVLDIAEPGRQVLEVLRECGCDLYTYYLVVGRFVAENNLDYIVREFVQSGSRKKLLVVSDIDTRSRFYRQKIAPFIANHGDMVKVLGAIYNPTLLQQLRRFSFAYIHGHEVGGTNPSLLEAMGAGNLVLALDVIYNAEVLSGSGILFRKETGSLAKAIRDVEAMPDKVREQFRKEAQNRVRTYYNWDRIVHGYRDLILGDGNSTTCGVGSRA